METAIVERRPAQEQSEAASMLQVIERMASNPQVDVDKLERLLLMQERVVARQAEAEFAADLSAMQSDLPSVGERGNAAGRYTYALWEDINTQIKPVLQKHGFALSFRMDFTNGIAVTGVLSHRSGHSERTTIVLPADSSGNKNAVQAVASSVSYGKRYTAGALLNLTSHGEDDDAYRAAETLITEEQTVIVKELLESTGADQVKFLAWLKVDSIGNIPVRKYDEAVAQLKRREKSK